MLNLIVLSILLCHYTQAKPAFAGGLSGPVVPAGAMHPPPPSQATAAPGDADCPPTDGALPLYVPDETSCTKYTVCSGGFGMKMDCPPGLHFNRNMSYCDFPPNAKCPLLEGVTEKVSFADLQGPPGIDPTAYPNVGLTALPKFGNPDPAVGQLSDTEFVGDQASKAGPSTYRPDVEQMPTAAREATKIPPTAENIVVADGDEVTAINNEVPANEITEVNNDTASTDAEVTAVNNEATATSNEAIATNNEATATNNEATATNNEATTKNNEPTPAEVTTVKSRTSKLKSVVRI